MSGGPRGIHYTVHGRFILVVAGDETPSESNWQNYVRTCEQVAETNTTVRLLVFTGEGIPTPTQRRQFTTVLGRRPHRIAVMSPSVVARTIVTALGWLGANVRAFPPIAREAAVAYLELESGEVEWARTAEAALRFELANETVKSKA